MKHKYLHTNQFHWQSSSRIFFLSYWVKSTVGTYIYIYTKLDMAKYIIHYICTLNKRMYLDYEDTLYCRIFLIKGFLKSEDKIKSLCLSIYLFKK